MINIRRLPGQRVPTGERIWAAMHAAKGWARLDAIARRAGTTVGTARGYVREWALAGYVDTRAGLAGQYGMSVRIKCRFLNPPTITRDAGGSLTYVSHPSDRHKYAVISRRPGQPPVVNHYDRRTPAAHADGGAA